MDTKNVPTQARLEWQDCQIALRTVFGLGTLPTLLLVGHFAQNVKLLLQNKWIRIGLGILLIAYGIIQITGGTGMVEHQH